MKKIIAGTIIALMLLCFVGVEADDLKKPYTEDEKDCIPNWDVKVDHDCNINDLIYVAMHFDETGEPHWVRADAVEDGEVNMLDLLYVAEHFDETW